MKAIEQIRLQQALQAQKSAGPLPIILGAVIALGIGLLGASGVVFMFILLSSVTNARRGRIPLTFVLVVLLFLGQEVWNGLTQDNVSQFAHVIGGLCGAAFGFRPNLAGDK